MTTPGHAAATRSLWSGFGEAWTAVSYLLCGVLVWGGAGYGLDRWLGTGPVLTIVGTVIGNAGGVYLIYVRMVPRAHKKVSRQRG